MKVYIICPYLKTGGPRSFHQLANQLVQRGLDVYMFYGEHGLTYKTDRVLYDDCKAKIAEEIEDVPGNVVIVPESDTGWLLKYKNILGVIWWVSLNFYLTNNLWVAARNKTIYLGDPKLKALGRYIKYELDYMRTHKSRKYVKKSGDLQKFYHLYNSEYAADYLRKRGITEDSLQYLCGPIDVITTDNAQTIKDNKEDIIAFNPTKANKVMLKNIKAYMAKYYPQVRFIEIIGMTREQVADTLKKAKVYLDLGYFPGPERIPREAVTYYCNIVTSNLGSASNNVDVPIPREYKFAMQVDSVAPMCELMAKMIMDFSAYTTNFDKYRAHVQEQIQRFDKDIDIFCEYIEKNNA